MTGYTMFHIRKNKYGRAFCQPKRGLSIFSMYFRGWRSFGLGGWWSKPSKNQGLIEKNMTHNAELSRAGSAPNETAGVNSVGLE